jgi:protoheme IX farnesyltransferase
MIMLLDLTKIPIVPAVSLSAVMGYILFAGRLDWGILPPTAGVFLLACGCSALNQVQEAGIDARMMRTKSRPIPSGRLESHKALFISITLVLLGFFALSFANHHDPTVLMLGLFALIWYNIIYTYLKRISSFAIVPGAIVGAVPPAIGWVAAGGTIWDPALLLVAFFYFIWQIPHFWLLILMRSDEYRQAGLPSPEEIFSRIQLQRITFIWITATASAGVMAALLIDVHAPWNLLFLIVSTYIVAKNLSLLKSNGTQPDIRQAFLQLIAYLMIVTALFCLDSLF